MVSADEGMVGEKRSVPYKGYGLLLGCEVLGSGRAVYDSTEPRGSRVRVIQDLASILPRYLFLIPSGYRGHISSTKSVQQAMMVAFYKIEKGLENSYYKGPLDKAPPKIEEQVVDQAQHVMEALQPARKQVALAVPVSYYLLAVVIAVRMFKQWRQL
ncbi:uncharacterized protein RAG0_09482 [Rhynchosporium agropyri]|uniref:Uncharacterized protein n=1 Tax=Rhynchosporium agropyri TaxID=914238 RepID=A0A1E1KVP1_9HELO|nr:uncharacterized protein RAG0_09482 [Rhynchosporium agropyri]